MIVGHAVACGYVLLHQTQRIVLAGIVGTDEYLLLTIDTRVAHGAGASVGGQFVHTDATILARGRGALVDLLLTDASMPTGGTFAAELQAASFDTLAAMLTTRAGACKEKNSAISSVSLSRSLSGAGFSTYPCHKRRHPTRNDPPDNLAGRCRCSHCYGLDIGRHFDMDLTCIRPRSPRNLSLLKRRERETVSEARDRDSERKASDIN